MGSGNGVPFGVAERLLLLNRNHCLSDRRELFALSSDYRCA